MNKASMQNWEEAWHNADVHMLQSQYLADAIVFPVNKSAIFGNENIVEFFKGGFGKSDVKFFPDELIVEGNSAFEIGVFKDFEKVTEKVVGSGNYVIIWWLQDEMWKIKFHTWTVSN